jgi:hypothetical protein
LIRIILLSRFYWWAVQDLNLRPSVCKTDALPLS